MIVDAVRKMEDEFEELRELAEKLISRLQSELQIDIYKLDEVCANHAQLYFEVAKLHSLTDSFFKRTQLLVSEIKAEVAQKIRANPEEWGIVKITENQIQENVDRCDETIRARNLRAKAEQLSVQTFSLVEAYNHRRSMINNEVQLLVNQLVQAREKADDEEYKRKLVRRRVKK